MFVLESKSFKERSHEDEFAVALAEHFFLVLFLLFNGEGLGVLVFFWCYFAVGESEVVGRLGHTASGAPGVGIYSCKAFEVFFVSETVDEDTAVDLSRLMSFVGRWD